ncbi:MAG: site-specific DNA-methyltransferase [Phycisphaerales bacterium]|nr:MAG: site-specific DNA-methyltransferase [Phycisphaerales bacterium]
MMDPMPWRWPSPRREAWPATRSSAYWGHPSGVRGGAAGNGVRWRSRAGENVLDLFGGSGSTLIAADQTGRRAFLMELDPLYCDVIVQRWEHFTGQRAERISDRSNAPAVAEASREGERCVQAFSAKAKYSVIASRCTPPVAA